MSGSVECFQPEEVKIFHNSGMLLCHLQDLFVTPAFRKMPVFLMNFIEHRSLVLSDPAAVVQLAVTLLLGNPVAGETFGHLPTQADRCHVLGGLRDTLKGLLRSFPLP